MTIRGEKFTIRLPRPFRIAHGSSATRDTILVHVQEGDLTGHGEGALPPYYPSRTEDCLAWLEHPETPPPPAAAAAQVALEIARHDLEGQRAGQPLWRLWGLDATRIPECHVTLSIPENEKELHKTIDEALAAGARCLKLKSGSGDLAWDEKCARLLGSRGVPFSLDANAAWSPAEAARIIPRLEVEFVEQPVGRDLELWRELRRLCPSKIPLVADESLAADADLEALSSLADGVNIKLLKAGGLDGARRWITRARQLGLRVMIGVMVETGIGRTAAAQLAPLADWLDIDPPSSIPPAPLSGFAFKDGRLVLSDRPGLGLADV